MEGEKKRRGKTKGTMRAERISSQTAGTETNNAMTTSVAEETRNVSSAGDNRTCSDGESKENRGGNSVSSTEGKGSFEQTHILWMLTEEGIVIHVGALDI